MTCVIGLIRNGHIYMGSDSLSLDGWHRVRTPHKKIFRKGDMLIGTAGNQRISDIIEYNLVLPDEAAGDYLGAVFIPALRACIDEHGGKIEDSTLLIGYKGELFFVGEDFSFLEVGSYEAIGAGAKYALGYMYAMEKTCLSPERLITKALECAAWFSASCAGPFVVEVA